MLPSNSEDRLKAANVFPASKIKFPSIITILQEKGHNIRKSLMPGLTFCFHFTGAHIPQFRVLPGSRFRVQETKLLYQRFPSVLAEGGESGLPRVLWENKGVLPVGIHENSSKGPLMAGSVPAPGRTQPPGHGGKGNEKERHQPFL